MVISLIVGLVGWFSREFYLIGIAASMSLFGIVSTVIGLEYHEPNLEFLIRYSDIFRNTILTLLEHLDIKPMNIYAVPKNDIVYIVITDMKKPPTNPSSFIRAENNSIYIGLEVPMSEEYVAENTSPYNVREYIKEIIISKYSIANNVDVNIDNNNITVLMDHISPQLLDLLKKPLSPLTLLPLTMIAKTLNKTVALRSEKIMNESLVIELEVL